jgi:hypothetical protein
MTNLNPPCCKSSTGLILAFLFCAANPAFAQVPAPGPPATPEAAQQQFPSSPAWGQLPKMQLEAQFAGPLQDTIVQRWRVPSDGATCFIYLPIAAAHTPPTATGFVQYGSNTIGNISCFAGPPRKQPASNPPPGSLLPPKQQ